MTHRSQEYLDLPRIACLSFEGSFIDIYIFMRRRLLPYSSNFQPQGIIHDPRSRTWDESEHNLIAPLNQPLSRKCEFLANHKAADSGALQATGANVARYHPLEWVGKIIHIGVERECGELSGREVFVACCTAGSGKLNCESGVGGRRGLCVEVKQNGEVDFLALGSQLGIILLAKPGVSDVSQSISEE